MIPSLVRKAYLIEGVAQVKDLLLSQAIQWPMGAMPLPLSIGNLITELGFYQVDDPEAAVGISEQIHGIRQHWQVRWSEKAGREASSRLLNWEQAAGHDANTDATYLADARNRLVIQYLLEQTPSGFNIAALDVVDQKIRKGFIPAPFILPPVYEKLFQDPKFWFLFVNIKK